MDSSEENFDDVLTYGDEPDDDVSKTITEMVEDLAERTHTDSRTLVYIAAGIGTLMLILIVVVFGHLIHTGQSFTSKEPTRQATTSHVPSASASATAKQEEQFTLEQGRERLGNLTNTSTCQGEEDARFFITFTRLSEEAEEWDGDKAEVDARLKELTEKCGDSYALSLTNRLRSDSTPEGLQELVDTTLGHVGQDKRPAPDDAIEMQSFSTPKKNIRCSFDGDTTSCTIDHYTYESTACNGSPITYSIASDGRVSQECEAKVTSDSVVSYGTTAHDDNFACTVTDDGVECWHKKTGKGFTLGMKEITSF